MVKVKRLQPGSIVRWISPASPVEEGKISKATALLESWGLKVQISPHALDQEAYLAGSDKDRASDLMDAFLDPGVDGVLCTRGGYGAARLFPYLALKSIAQSGKCFLGFSDITTLHIAFNQLGLPTMHGPMALTLNTEREPWVYDSLRNCLFNDCAIPPEAPNGETVVGGLAEGILTGGCMCLIGDSLGTDLPLNGDGKIILLEDVDENPHRIDAMLTHFINAGVFHGAKGIVVGEMTRTDEQSDDSIGSRPWREIVIERLAPLQLPLIINFPIGHAKNMLTLPLGVPVHLDADHGRLNILDHPYAL